jgi:hypothetical protein
MPLARSESVAEYGALTANPAMLLACRLPFYPRLRGAMLTTTPKRNLLAKVDLPQVEAFGSTSRLTPSR